MADNCPKSHWDLNAWLASFACKWVQASKKEDFRADKALPSSRQQSLPPPESHYLDDAPLLLYSNPLPPSTSATTLRLIQNTRNAPLNEQSVADNWKCLPVTQPTPPNQPIHWSDHQNYNFCDNLLPHQNVGGLEE